jgi:26S proteasome regulatory subunit N1
LKDEFVAAMAPKDKDAVELTAESEEKKKVAPKKDTEGAIVNPDDNLSDEDRELKERLETCVTTVSDNSLQTGLRMQALEVIVTELRTSTSSMTSVPKPLKFLRPHFNVLKALYAPLSEKNDMGEDDLEFRARLADVLAVLAMTMSKPEERASLKFKLAATKDYDKLRATSQKQVPAASENLGSWGHEFVRSLAGEIGEEYQARVIAGSDPAHDAAFQDVLDMVDVIVPFHVTHNAEAEAVDLLIEVQRLKKLLGLAAIDENNYGRICLYLIKTADFMSDPEDYVVSVHCTVS